MSAMRGLGICLGLALSSCAEEPDIPPGADCPNTPGLATGDLCNTTARCLNQSADCGLAQVCECDLTSKTFRCTDVDFSAPCDGIQNAYCEIEGVYGCALYPTSGTRSCEGDEWVEWSSCPAGCPGPESGEPATGDPCAVAPGDVCPYGASECECVADMFMCCAVAPCVFMGQSWAKSGAQP